jgi:two-component system chemotaxis response regulator CheB
VADVFGGAAIAAVLTGMGQDGLNGARAMRALGAHILAQDEASYAFGHPQSCG